MAQTNTEARTYRLFVDPGHAWLAVLRAEVEASDADISRYSYYDPVTGMAYLEEDCDLPSFLEAAGKDQSCIGETVQSDLPGRLPHYGSSAFLADHVLIVKPDRG